MGAATEMGRLSRQVDAVAALVEEGVHPRARGPLSPADRRALRAEIESCIQRLDELRALLKT